MISKEKRQEYAKAYYLKNKEKLRAKQKEHYKIIKADPIRYAKRLEHYREYNKLPHIVKKRQAYAKSDKRKATAKRYQTSEKGRAYSRKYYANNKDKFKAYAMRPEVKERTRLRNQGYKKCYQFRLKKRAASIRYRAKLKAQREMLNNL